MKFLSAYIHTRSDKEGLTAKAQIEVEGIGNVEFDHAVSKELCEALAKETIEALKVKFGQRLKETQKENNGD